MATEQAQSDVITAAGKKKPIVVVLRTEKHADTAGDYSFADAPDEGAAEPWAADADADDAAEQPQPQPTADNSAELMDRLRNSLDAANQSRPKKRDSSDLASAFAGSRGCFFVPYETMAKIFAAANGDEVEVKKSTARPSPYPPIMTEVLNGWKPDADPQPLPLPHAGSDYGPTVIALQQQNVAVLYALAQQYEELRKQICDIDTKFASKPKMGRKSNAEKAAIAAEKAALARGVVAPTPPQTSPPAAAAQVSSYLPLLETYASFSIPQPQAQPQPQPQPQPQSYVTCEDSGNASIDAEAILSGPVPPPPLSVPLTGTWITCPFPGETTPK